jgi:hypothetical protein
MWVIARNQPALLLRRRGPAPAVLEEVPHGGLDPAEAAMIRADIATALSGPDGEVPRLMYVREAARPALLRGRRGLAVDSGGRPGPDARQYSWSC